MSAQMGTTAVRLAAPIGYLSGPVDARGIYDAEVAQIHTRLFGSSYLSLYFKLLAAAGVSGVVVTSEPGIRYAAERGNFIILNRPKTAASGWRYHYNMMRWTFSRLKEMRTLGVKTVIMTDAADYWFVSLPFRIGGMRFVNSFHCALRPLGHRVISVREPLIRLTSWFHLSFGDASMCVSPLIKRQLAGEAGSSRRASLVFKPHYDREKFAGIAKPDTDSVNQFFDIVFAGRVERNKGVFDMLEICKLLAKRTGPVVRFHVHGEGDALVELREAVAASGLGDRYIIYGFTAGLKLMDHYSSCDAIIVPTRSDFEEGLAKSVVEGVLAFRAVITSQACPAIEVVGKACVEAEVDNPADYAEKIWELANDLGLRREKSEAAADLRELFFDPDDNYEATLARVLRISVARDDR